jgi:hypothetical protein
MSCVEAEYCSAVLTQRLVLWLMQLLAPLQLIRMGLVIVEDELAHSELSHRVYTQVGGTEPADLGSRNLGTPALDPKGVLHAVVRTGLESFCLGETVAVRLFSRLRSGCTESSARTALDRILKDEVRHKEFGWTLLEWLLSLPAADSVRALIDQELPAMFERLRRSYAYSQLGATSARVPAQSEWGLMPPSEYAAALDETLTQDYIPLFNGLGIDAKRAWQARLG